MPCGADHWGLFRCPSCGGALDPGDTIVCGNCGARYPRVDGIPWLCADAEAVLGDWRSRSRAHITQLMAQSAAYRAALTDDVRRATTRNRLKLLSTACSDHARRLAHLLAPLDVAAAAAAPETYHALGRSVPLSQGLASYYANVHRDWLWGDVENEGTFRAVDEALGNRSPGATLVLGCGAGRLAYDLHVRRRPLVTVAADLNPLMLIIARRVLAGEPVSLYEFPLAPRDLASNALLRDLKAPAPAPPGLVLLGADASRAPFAQAAFDTVVTPWLIDILDEDAATFCARLGNWLKPGGRWINSGTLFFQHDDPVRCYSLDELPDLLGEAGFVDIQIREKVVPYLASPASRHARMERLVTFAATLRSPAAQPPAHRCTPAWLEHADLPVPLHPGVASEALAMRVRAYVASLVDGRRTLADIADVLVRERLMPGDEALPTVRAFLERLAADSSSR